MSRTDNRVFLMGKVVRGPIASQPNGKLRISYQLELMHRNKDKGLVTKPWILSCGNQAEKDYQNIKNGDIVAVSGRIITPTRKQELYVIPDPNDSEQLMVVDPEDDECPDFDENLMKRLTLSTVETKVMTDDVWYFPKFVEMLTDDERKKLFSYKVLKEVAASLEIKEKRDYDPDIDED